MAIRIPLLKELTGKEIDRVTDLFMDAFQEYPKLKFAFPEKEKKLAALEATIRFYASYDIKFGKGYSLDSSINEAVLIVESDQIKYTAFRHLRAGSYSLKYRKAMNRLKKEDRQKRIRLFEELDAMEQKLNIPRPHLYVDFFGSTNRHAGAGKRAKTHGAYLRLCR